MRKLKLGDRVRVHENSEREMKGKGTVITLHWDRLSDGEQCVSIQLDDGGDPGVFILPYNTDKIIVYPNDIAELIEQERKEEKKLNIKLKEKHVYSVIDKDGFTHGVPESARRFAREHKRYMEQDQPDLRPFKIIKYDVAGVIR